MNKEQIFDHVRNHRDEPLKDDAIYLARVTQFRSLLDLVEDMVNKSQKDLPTVLQACVKNREVILNSFPFIGEAFDVLIKDFS